MKYFLLWSLLFFFVFQCIPDPKKSLALPAPYNVEVSTSGNDILLKVQGDYDKDTYSSFIGYNVYIGFVNNTSEIRKRIIYFDNFLPSIAASPGKGNKEEKLEREIEFKNLFEDKENGIVKDSRQIENIRTFSNYYFIVKPIDNTKKEGANNQQLLYVKPFLTKKNLTFDITSGNLKIENLLEININNSLITPLNKTGIINYGYRNNILEIKETPHADSGAYSQNEKVVLKKNYLYAINFEVHYFKFYIVDINGNTITYDYCYQQQEGLFK